MSLINVNMRPRRILIKPNETERVEFVGSYISILTNNTTVDVLVCVDGGTTAPVKAGIGFPTVRLSEDKTTHIPAVFSFVDFTNPSNTETMEIEYLLSLGPVDDTRTVVQGYIQMDLSAPKISTPEAVVVPTGTFAVLPSDALIKERIVSNTGIPPVWFGDETTDPATGRGTPINPGGTAVINCWGAIHFKAEGVAGRISINNILKVS